MSNLIKLMFIITLMQKIMPLYWLCLVGMGKCGISAINAIVHRRPSPLGSVLYGWCGKNTYIAPLMSLGMLSRRGMWGSRLSVTFVARLMSPRTARLEANAVTVCRRAMWPVTVPILPTFGAPPRPMLLLMCQVWLLLLLRRFRPTFQLPLAAGDLKSICKIVDVFLPLKVFETVPSSLRHSSLLALVTLLSVRQLFHLTLMTLWTKSHVV